MEGGLVHTPSQPDTFQPSLVDGFADLGTASVDASDECVGAFRDLKTGKYNSVLYKLSDDNKEIVVDQTSAESDYDDFTKKLPTKECRYAVHNFRFTTDGTEKSKIVFILWAPDEAKVMQKMIYTSAKDSIKRKLTGLDKEITATEKEEMDYSVVLEKVGGKA